MKNLFGVLGVALLVSSASADVTMMDNDKTQTVDCDKEKSVTVMGNKNTVTLTGVCDSVTINGNEVKVIGSVKSISVNGNDNHAELDGVDKISVNGSKNSVTWKKALDAKLKKPKTSSNGAGNSIKKG
jgi:hypothetical protein